MIRSDDTEEDYGGRKTRKKKREMETEREKRGEREIASPRQEQAMRGTAVGSFLSGSVNPHAPHTHTHIFIQLLSRKARVLLGGVMMEGNYGDTSLTPRSSPDNLDLPRLPALSVSYYRPALQHGCRVPGFLSRLSAAEGGGRSTRRMHWVCGQWRHGERGREGRLYFGIGYRGPFIFFPLLPVVLWPTYR